MELKVSNLRRKHVRNTTWPKEKKLQAVAQYLALGNMKLVEATTGVNYGLLRQWKMQPWWKEYESEIRNTENVKLDSKLTTIVEKSLEAVANRLEHGEPVWNSKTGTIDYKPVNMKDANKVAVDLLTKRELLRGNATSRTEAVAIPMADQLKALAAEFARMTSGKPSEVIEVHATDISDATYSDDEDDTSVLEAGGFDDAEEATEDTPDDSGGPRVDEQPEGRSLPEDTNRSL